MNKFQEGERVYFVLPAQPGTRAVARIQGGRYIREATPEGDEGYAFVDDGQIRHVKIADLARQARELRPRLLSAIRTEIAAAEERLIMLKQCHADQYAQWFKEIHEQPNWEIQASQAGEEAAKHGG